MRIMRMLTLGLAAFVALVSLSPGKALAEPLTGDQYLLHVADALRSNHVYVDPDASPRLSKSEARTLNDQIVASGKPIYFAMIDNQQTFNFGSPEDFMEELYWELDIPSGAVVAVSTERGFRAMPLDLPAKASKSVIKFSEQAGNAKLIPGHSKRFSEYSWWVGEVSTLDFVTSGTPLETDAGTSVFNEKTMLVLIGILFFLVLLTFIPGRKRKKRNQHRNTSPAEPAYVPSKYPAYDATYHSGVSDGPSNPSRPRKPSSAQRRNEAMGLFNRDKDKNRKRRGSGNRDSGVGRSSSSSSSSRQSSDPYAPGGVFFASSQTYDSSPSSAPSSSPDPSPSSGGYSYDGGSTGGSW